MAKDSPARTGVYEARAAEALMRLVGSEDEQVAATAAAGLASLAVARRLAEVAAELSHNSRVLGSGR